MLYNKDEDERFLWVAGTAWKAAHKLLSRKKHKMTNWLDHQASGFFSAKNPLLVQLIT